jgi:FKBP-type peptidyl-prolyl cis-trans isomerase
VLISLQAIMALARAAARREKELKKSEEHKSSRVQVNVIQPGDAFNFPKTGDCLSIHYTTELEDGTKIDNSYQRGQPLNIVLGAGHVIPGYVFCSSTIFSLCVCSLWCYCV